MHYVQDDKIFNETGEEIIWRGAGGSYLFHTNDYMLAWEKHLPEIQKMGLNTVRLAFRFSFDNVSGADLLNYSKFDEILNWLDQHSIKAILDNHGGMGFGSQELIDAWVELTAHYKNDSRIVAYELYNEPGKSHLVSSIKSGEDVARTYANLTQEIRKVDPDRIHIWQARPYYYFDKPLDEFSSYLQPNVVYTMHRWWTSRQDEFEIWTTEEISYKDMNYLVEMRKRLNVPFWLGEFGLGGGGNWRYNHSNPFSQMAEQLLYRSEEQSIGWNLWQGNTSINKPWYSQDMFPLKIYNGNLLRQPWYIPIPKLSDYIIDQKGVDSFSSYEPWEIGMWHNRDYVTFNRGIILMVDVNTKLPNGTVEAVSKEIIEITKPTNITNYEGGNLGDRNTWIYSIGKIVKLYGRLTSKDGNPILANVSLYKQGTKTINASGITMDGNYSLSAKGGIFDLQYDISHTTNMSIKLISIGMVSDLNDAVNYIDDFGNGVSFTINIDRDQEVQMHSDEMPARVLKNEILLKNVSSYSELTSNTWFYNSSEKRIYMVLRFTG